MTATLSRQEHVGDPPSEVSEVAQMLHATMASLIAALPGQPQRPMDVARKVGADKSIAHRLMTALAKGPGIGVLLAAPGPVPLGEIVQAARKLGVDPSLCVDALQAVARFESLIQSLAGDRSTFDAMMSEWADDARGPIDTAARQMIFRGMKHVHGVAAKTSYTAFLLHPSGDSKERGDYMALDCLLGLYRVRSGGHLVVKTTSDLRGSAVVADSTRTLIEEFCSRPVPKFSTSGPADALTCEMDWNGRLGWQQTCDVVVGEVHRNVFTYRRSKPERKYGGVGCCPWVPVRQAVMDLLLHRDVFPTCIPSFNVYRTGIHGLPDPNDPSRQFDRIRIDSETQALGAGSLSRVLTPEVPIYRKLLESQCASRGWDLSQFRGFRVRIDYPIFDTQMMYVITLPD